MDEISPQNDVICQTGCWQCGTTCPWTDETEPPLTQQIADLWFESHKEICPAPDWPNTENPVHG